MCSTSPSHSKIACAMPIANSTSKRRTAAIQQCSFATAALLQALELDREADREQHAEQAVELAAEEHVDDEESGLVPERRRLVEDRHAAEAGNVDDEDAE